MGFLPESLSVGGADSRARALGQVHAKVMPHVADEIANEAKRRGVQQGVLIEEAWHLYKT